MPGEIEIYAQHAVEYEALVSREDYEGNIVGVLKDNLILKELQVLDLGTGTGRLARLLSPHVRSVMAFDLSQHMLEVARDRLQGGGSHNWLIAAAEHRYLPLPNTSADLIVSGWSVSYLTVWHAGRGRVQADAWFAEARRVLRPGGRIVLFESLGTGNESPQRLPHLEDFYGWLDDQGFQNAWIRTDYRFENPEIASQLAGFFFGQDLKEMIGREQLTILPECTGVWSLDV